MSDTTVTTAQDLIYFALKATGVLGVGQTPLDEDLNDSFKALNMMLGVWNRKRWLIWHLRDVAAMSTGALYYTIGVGQQFDVPRPDRIEAAYFRQFGIGSSVSINGDPAPGIAIMSDGPLPVLISPDGLSVQAALPIDYPLSILEAREDYSRISIKQLSTFSRYVFYDADYPVGKIYTWPVLPPTLFELHVLVKETLTEFATIDTAIAMPGEFKEALWSNLSLRLRTIYKIPAPPPGQDDVKDIAKGALDTIRGANTQIPRLMMPARLYNRGGQTYNIYGDTGY